GIAELIDKEKPDMIMAQGDTTTVFAAALTSFYYRIPFAHVEAGLRTQNRYSPFPEEINRRLTSPLTEVHLAPTETARKNLLKENIKPETIYVTGNTVIDALFYILDKPDIKQRNLVESLNVQPKKFILVTAHRRE
ncbi:UDP-N-acetylglucosamine 2-epimerase, partial [Arthrospira platensis SPKY1]|nr:UDP-N-acetylglucosamine 2-epimerase [Arthrospira platensis SPKY1]